MNKTTLNEKLIADVKNTDAIDTENTKDKVKFKRKLRNGNLREWKEKRMYGQFIREMPDTTNKAKAWEWLRKSHQKVETEALICAAQKHAFRTSSFKYNIDKTTKSPLCRMYGE